MKVIQNSQYLNESPYATITGEDDKSRTPSLLLERGAADTLAALRTSPGLASMAEINNNLLDVQQQKLLVSKEREKNRSESITRLASQRDYVFVAYRG